MPEPVVIQTLSNGLTVLCQRFPQVRSATLTWQWPAGLIREPESRRGVGTLLAELMMRGAGPYSSRALTETLDELGTDRSESIGLQTLTLGCGTLGRNLEQVIDVYTEIVRRPHLPEDELEDCQQLMMQDYAGLEDSPNEKLMLTLKEQTYPAPFGRHVYLPPQAIEQLTITDVQDFYRDCFTPAGATFSVAGAIDPEAVIRQIEARLGDWHGPKLPELHPEATSGCSIHLPKETQQTYMAFSVRSAPFQSEDYYAARGLVGVLSGGMSSRLFTELREKRGLCYSVSAGHDVAGSRGCLIGFSATRPDRAQETLDVLWQEFRRLEDGIHPEELDRLKISLKSALVLQQESTAARASAMAGDWFYLKRVRTLDEILERVETLSPRILADYLARYPIERPVVATLGPAPLQLPAGAAPRPTQNISNLTNPVNPTNPEGLSS